MGGDADAQGGAGSKRSGRAAVVAEPGSGRGRHEGAEEGWRESGRRDAGKSPTPPRGRVRTAKGRCVRRPRAFRVRQRRLVTINEAPQSSAGQCDAWPLPRLAFVPGPQRSMSRFRACELVTVGRSAAPVRERVGKP
eukprot:2370304-Prymnesium_polylepis.1